MRRADQQVRRRRPAYVVDGPDPDHRLRCAPSHYALSREADRRHLDADDFTGASALGERYAHENFGSVGLNFASGFRDSGSAQHFQ
jgi:hypothetical protein